MNEKLPLEWLSLDFQKNRGEFRKYTFVRIIYKMLSKELLFRGVAHREAKSALGLGSGKCRKFWAPFLAPYGKGKCSDGFYHGKWMWEDNTSHQGCGEREPCVLLLGTMS